MPSRALLVWMSASLLGGFACASSPQEESTALAEPDPPPPVAASEEATAEPADGSSAAAEPAWPARAATASEPAAAVITGIPICDEYLALYERCEEYLKPEIMAGDRRFYRAEKASLQYLAGTPEVAHLPDGCRSMLDALRVDCPEQHRRPPASGSAREGTTP